MNSGGSMTGNVLASLGTTLSVQCGCNSIAQDRFDAVRIGAALSEGCHVGCYALGSLDITRDSAPATPALPGVHRRSRGLSVLRADHAAFARSGPDDRTSVAADHVFEEAASSCSSLHRRLGISAPSPSLPDIHFHPRTPEMNRHIGDAIQEEAEQKGCRQRLEGYLSYMPCPALAVA